MASFMDWVLDVAAEHPDLEGAFVSADGQWLDILLPDGRTFRFRPSEMIAEDKPEDIRRKLLATQNQPAARPAQRLVRRRSHKIRKRNRTRMHPRRNQPRKVRHIHHQQRPHTVRNLTEPREIHHPRIRAAFRDKPKTPGTGEA